MLKPDLPFASIEEVLVAYDAELDELSRRAILAPRSHGEEAEARVLAAHEAAKDVWARYEPVAARLGQAIEAGQGRARFFNALTDAATARWGAPPEPYASAVAWQRTHAWVDPDRDAPIIGWVAGRLGGEWADTPSGSPKGPAQWVPTEHQRTRVSETAVAGGTRIKRKLIEVALPLEAINVASAREKSIRHGHPSTLHIWWARRPLAACRAVLFASLVDDPSADPARFPTPKSQEDERRRLFDIIERLVVWENTTNETVLEEARIEIRRSTGGNPPAVLDPFCGGGSIPLEAQRLGLEAYASDINPVAVLINKALVEIPPKFAGRPPVHPDARRGIGATGSWAGAAGLAEDVRRYGTWIRDEAERRIGHLYPNARLPKELGGGEATIIAWLWARTVSCPNPACGALMPLVRSFELSRRKGKEAWVVPAIDPASRTVSFTIAGPSGKAPEPPKSGRGASFRCLVCGQVAPDEHIKSEGRAKRMGAQLMAIVAEGDRGRIFLPPDADQARTAECAMPKWAPDQMLADDPRNLWCVNYGLTRFRDLFTPRQLVALTTFGDLVGEASSRIQSDALAAGFASDPRPLSAGGVGAAAYADAISTYSALALSKAADLSSNICVWQSNAEHLKLAHVFARQAIPMTWDFAEGNPFSVSSGNFHRQWDLVGEILDAVVPGAGAHVGAVDAASLQTSSQAWLVSTDPPYYDNIGYADLSDFFYVWLRRALGDVYPELFSTMVTPKLAELVATPYRFEGSKVRAEEHFEAGLGRAFDRLRDAADPTFPVTVYYAFKQAESADGGGNGDGPVMASTGWETMLEGLLRAGFSICGTWPMRTEREGRTLSIGTNALASSVVLVCRLRDTGAGITSRKDFVTCLKRELPEALRTLQHGNIAPVDLAQASIGPGMAVFSRYAKVLETDGSPMRVRTALELINQVLDELLAEQEGEFDADTRWAIAWYEQNGLGEAEYGVAETLSKAKNSSVAGLVEAGIVAAGRGRVRLLARAEYDLDWDPATDTRLPAWEATQRLVHALLDGGEGAAAEMQAKLGGLGEQARDLAYRLYQTAERKGWTDEARAYNALVVAWPDLLRGAERVRAAEPSQPSLGLE
jgi:putative DNA methylase